MTAGQNQNKKTLRHFQCRDFLWEIFEQMSAELECSIDYLINEAMRQYARSRNYGPRTSAGVSTGSSAPAPTGAAALPPRPRAPTPPPVPASPMPSRSAALAAPSSAQRPSPSSAPPPLPPRGAAASPVPAKPAPPPGATLYLVFNGQKIPVTKEQFIIGRGSKSSDLPIKDGNISRKHAAVILHQGAYYLKDLGSTNGIEYNGRRIEQKRVEEGDIFHICDYELRFTYR